MVKVSFVKKYYSVLQAEKVERLFKIHLIDIATPAHRTTGQLISWAVINKSRDAKLFPVNDAKIAFVSHVCIYATF